ncbi:DJ-1/PfpI family protein [Aerococcus sanguinicola]|uniref:DJ-1/PfpI family protein n=2 Tax=Aerococcaceae TaxID=186827 RepID=A0A5N1GFW5_9LACT|nr:DJ-1 family glyoxalase III [Aerococcus sp. UMB9870]KAA9299274.1 DJ-1/PfpI family protein [Aerococcus sanguinicola]
MMRAMILLGSGYEEVEALTVVDWFRRAGLTIDMVSVSDNLETVGDHQIHIQADKRLADIDAGDYDLIVTPGGMPASKQLAADSAVLDLVQSHHQAGKWLASICASPLILEAAGIAGEAVGTCYPGIEEEVHFKEHKEDIVVVDEAAKLVTSRGPATATYFALYLVERFAGEEAAHDLKQALLLDRVEASLADHA